MVPQNEVKAVPNVEPMEQIKCGPMRLKYIPELAILPELVTIPDLHVCEAPPVVVAQCTGEKRFVGSEGIGPTESATMTVTEEHKPSIVIK
jgi:hypothetical protein